jgi:membrane protease YdiL (CAAX protease family)
MIDRVRDVSVKRRKAWLALALLVPVPSLSVLAGMVLWPGSVAGKMLFAGGKVWILALPVLWLKYVDRGSFSLSPARKGGFGIGLLSGVGVSALVLLAWFVLGRGLVDEAVFAGKMKEIGLGSMPVYLACAAYWILVNSVLEEYVWRWFVYDKCATLVRPAAAVALSALFFALHHFLALQAFISLPIALLCSVGVFIGGAVWSFLYERYESIWPGYLSHAVVDVCIFGIGAAML